MKWIVIDFSRTIYEWKKKNPWKSRHLLFWVHRVYGIQNDCLNLTVNGFLTVLKMLHRSKRYLQKCKTKNPKNWKYLLLRCSVFKTIKNSLTLRSSTSRNKFFDPRKVDDGGGEKREKKIIFWLRHRVKWEKSLRLQKHHYLSHFWPFWPIFAVF